MKREILSCLLFVVAVVMSGQEGVIQSDFTHRRFTTHDGLPQMQTETIWQDSKGYIYIGTLSGFVRYDGRSMHPYLRGRRENIVGFVESSDDVSGLSFRRQWHISGNDVYSTPLTDRGELYSNFNSPCLPKGYVLVEDEEESNRRLCRFTDEGAEEVFKDSVLDKMTPDRKMYLDGEHIYIPTPEGLYVSHNGKVERWFDRPDLFSLLRQGNNLYVFASDGVYTLEHKSLKMVVNYEFSDPDYGLSVCSSDKGDIFIADAHTLYVFDGKSIHQLSGGYNMIKGIFCDKWDRLWLATYQGAYLFYQTLFETHRLIDTTDIIRTLCHDGTGKMVMGTLNGKVIRGDSIIFEQEGNFYNPNSVCLGGKVYMPGKGGIMCVDGENADWLDLPEDRYQFVSKNGSKLLIYSRSALVSYDPSDGSIDTLTTEIPHAWCGTVDKGGNIWIGSTFGLFWVTDSIDKESGMRKVNQKTLEPHKWVITSMVNSPNGDIVFASRDSVFLIRNGEIEDLTHKVPMIKNHEIRSIHFSPKGYLILAAIDGLLVARVDSEDDYKVDGVRWFDHTNGYTSLEALNSPMCEDANGRIWLAGIEDVTSFVPSELIAFDENDTVVRPPTPWWRHWWSLLLFAVVGILLGWWLIQKYVRRRMRRTLFKIQREMKQKELQIQAIRLKSFPHFHANVMAGIEYYVMNDPKEASNYMKLYSDFTNQTLSDINSTSRCIADEVDYARLYLQLEKMRFGDKLDFDIYVADNVNMQTHIPTMVIYTYCQNAIKHGIGNKPEGGKININITRQSNRVIVSVTDNGVGREAASKLNLRSTKIGLRILLEQIELYNQTNREHIEQTVHDLHDADGNASGTTFEMSVPINYNYSIDKHKTDLW